MIKTANDNTIERIISSTEKTVLLEFDAPWCGPCKALASDLERLAVDYEDSLDVIKIDVSESPEATAEYRVKAFPTLLIMKSGRIIENVTGFSGIDEIKDLLKKSGVEKRA